MDHQARGDLRIAGSQATDDLDRWVVRTLDTEDDLQLVMGLAKEGLEVRLELLIRSAERL